MEMLSTNGMHFDNKTDQGTGDVKNVWGARAGKTLGKVEDSVKPAKGILPNPTQSLNIENYFRAKDIAENGQGHQRLLPHDNNPRPQNE